MASPPFALRGEADSEDAATSNFTAHSLPHSASSDSYFGFSSVRYFSQSGNYANINAGLISPDPWQDSGVPGRPIYSHWNTPTALPLCLLVRRCGDGGTLTDTISRR